MYLQRQSSKRGGHTASCVTVPDLIPHNPARVLFVKVTKSLFGRKKNKSEFGMPVVLRIQSGGGGLFTYTYLVEV